MQQIGSDKSVTINAWADIVLNIWQQNLIEMQVYDTGELYNSLLQSLLYNAGNDSNKIEFSFALHGIFVDSGAGGEISAGNSDYIRKAKPWYSKALYGQMFRLRDILAEKYKIDAGNVISFQLNNRTNG